MVQRFEWGEEVAGGGRHEDVPCRVNPPPSLLLSSLLFLSLNLLLVCTLHWVQGPQLVFALYLFFFSTFSSPPFSVLSGSPSVLYLWPWAGGGKTTDRLRACRLWLCVCVFIFFRHLCVPLYCICECVCMCVYVRQIRKWIRVRKKKSEWVCKGEASRKGGVVKTAENKVIVHKIFFRQKTRLHVIKHGRWPLRERPGVLYAYESAFECTCQHVQQLWSS